MNQSPLAPDRLTGTDPLAGAQPYVALAREWSPLVLIAFVLFLALTLWTSCAQRSDVGEPGRYQMLLDSNGQIVVLDTATGETSVASPARKPAPVK